MEAINTSAMKTQIRTAIGQPAPLGATVLAGEQGVNFSLYSKDATRVSLLLFETQNSQTARFVLQLDPEIHKLGHYWFIQVLGIGHGQVYGYLVDGPHQPKEGLYFDGEKVLLDPYARATCVSDNYDRARAAIPGSNIDCCMKSVVVDPAGFDWQGTQPIRRPMADTVIYELHVAGFTKHPNSGIKKSKRGSYAGLIEKIPYLKSLGITAIELLPVQQFDVFDAPPERQNYWGYSPINFFSPHSHYSSDQSPLGAINEFKLMVREMHKAGIEVILDVVFNHTAEGGEGGPVLCFRGLQNDAYYLLDKKTGQYTNYSGCGNTVNANNSIMRRMIIDALHYWVTEMHVDGFRFDLASVLSRDSHGKPMPEPPLLWSIDTDPVLCGTKIIAEAWDAAGLYQVGSFIGDRWSEWNGRFRDDVRSFWKGDLGQSGTLASRLLGSPDIYNRKHHAPHRSINFICAHDGFTLNDLVSYKEKHNWANGEGNRDGENHNNSHNHGVEGPTQNPNIDALRLQQMKNMFATLFISLGTPMLSMGDEVRRTQKGNNNAYCQDNEISWFDWKLVEPNADLIRFVRILGQIRNQSEALERNIHTPLADAVQNLRLAWHGVQPFEPDWSGHARTLAFGLRHPKSHDQLYVICNAHWDTIKFRLPQPAGEQWHLMLHTGQPAPADIYLPEDAPVYSKSQVEVPGHAMLMFVRKVSENDIYTEAEPHWLEVHESLLEQGWGEE